MTLFLLLLWAFSCARSTTAAQSTTTYPLTVEFDVIFPRNDSYAPAPVFPIVFAVQNLGPAWPTTLIQLHWALVKYGESRIAGDFVTLGNSNSTGSEYITAWIPALNGTDAAGTYALGWDFTYTDCPKAQNGQISPNDRLRRTSAQGSLFFTIKPGAQQPDLDADLGSCPAHHATFGITGTFSMGSATFNEPRESCGIIAPSSPPANPCAARLDKAAASSIAAELTASACTASPPVLTAGCPTSTEESLGVRRWPKPGMLTGPLLAGLFLLALH